jgi:hypothetical protein
MGADDVIAWFKSRPPAELERVEVVVLDRSKEIDRLVAQQQPRVAA